MIPSNWNSSSLKRPTNAFKQRRRYGEAPHIADTSKNIPRTLQGGKARSSAVRKRLLSAPGADTRLAGLTPRRRQPDYRRFRRSSERSSHQQSTSLSGGRDLLRLLRGPPPVEETLSAEECEVVYKLFFRENAQLSFNEAWTKQTLTFRPVTSEVPFGLIQLQSGPCGAMAALQATVLRYILFKNFSFGKVNDKLLKLTVKEQDAALVRSITKIILRAGRNTRQYRYVTGNISTRDRGPGMFAALTVHVLREQDVKGFVRSRLASLKASGILNLLISAVLSRGLANVIDDMGLNVGVDGNLLSVEEDGTVLNTAQESVNLLLTGRAAGGVFNADDRDLIPLKGTLHRSQCGFMTYLESRYPEEAQVGSYFRWPKFPIWVLHTRGHFAILFSTDIDLLYRQEGENRVFQVYYCDPLVRDASEAITGYEIDRDKLASPQERDQVARCISLIWPFMRIRRLNSSEISYGEMRSLWPIM